MKVFRTCKPLILASASPRRRKFLTDLGLEFSCFPADIDETPQNREPPADFALRMADGKAATIARMHPASYVIGSDTVVTVDNMILGKPVDTTDALHLLRSLQGKTHQVITGLSLVNLRKNCHEQLTRITRVTFNTFDDAILQAYIDSGDPMDKAGAYGIQGQGAFLVRSIHGSCSNVIGLPLSTCISILLQHEVICPLPITPAVS
jgi:septum formation protein